MLIGMLNVEKLIWGPGRRLNYQLQTVHSFLRNNRTRLLIWGITITKNKVCSSMACELWGCEVGLVHCCPLFLSVVESH